MPNCKLAWGANRKARGKRRGSGDDSVPKVDENIREGRCSQIVNGKCIASNNYAPTEEECEEKLAELIREMDAKISEMKKAKV